jgi:hypothetical protein
MSFVIAHAAAIHEMFVNTLDVDGHGRRTVRDGAERQR